jgi:hypothetical protein
MVVGLLLARRTFSLTLSVWLLEAMLDMPGTDGKSSGAILHQGKQSKVMLGAFHN